MDLGGTSMLYFSGTLELLCVFFSILGTTKSQDCTGYDLAVFLSLVKPVGHPQSHCILEPWTL